MVEQVYRTTDVGMGCIYGYKNEEELSISSRLSEYNEMRCLEMKNFFLHPFLLHFFRTSHIKKSEVAINQQHDK